MYWCSSGQTAITLMALWLTIDFSYIHSLHVWEGKVQMLKLRKRSLYSSSWNHQARMSGSLCWSTLVTPLKETQEDDWCQFHPYRLELYDLSWSLLLACGCLWLHDFVALQRCFSWMSARAVHICQEVLVWDDFGCLVAWIKWMSFSTRRFFHSLLWSEGGSCSQAPVLT